jgi:hypothetical protein
MRRYALFTGRLRYIEPLQQAFFRGINRRLAAFLTLAPFGIRFQPIMLGAAPDAPSDVEILLYCVQDLALRRKNPAGIASL